MNCHFCECNTCRGLVLDGDNSPASVDHGDGRTCHKCGKGMTVQGLTRDYPPKRDETGRAVCPHCGAASGPGTTGFGFIGNLVALQEPNTACRNCSGRISGFVVAHACDCVTPDPYFCDARALATDDPSFTFGTGEWDD